MTLVITERLPPTLVCFFQLLAITASSTVPSSGTNDVCTPNKEATWVKYLEVPPYTSSIEITWLGPCPKRCKSVEAAALPLANANPYFPFSSAAICLSNASLLGLFEREYSNPYDV